MIGIDLGDEGGFVAAFENKVPCDVGEGRSMQALGASVQAALILLLSVLGHDADAAADDEARFQISIYSADVTIPLNHRCMGVLPTKSKWE